MSVDDMAAGLPMQVGKLIVHVLVVAQFDATERIDHAGKSAEGDLGHVIDLLSGDVLDLGGEFLTAIDLHYGVDLEQGVIHLHKRIAGHRNERAGAVLRLGEDEDCVGAVSGGVIAAGGAVALIGSEDEPCRGRPRGFAGEPVLFAQAAADPVPDAKPRAQRGDKHDDKCGDEAVAHTMVCGVRTRV